MILILFGVSGAGKTTVGKILAHDLGWKFYEADDFHSQANIDKMKAGIPLTDADRGPWLECLRDLIEKSAATGEDAVLACSALKGSYRERLRVSDVVKFVYLRGSFEQVNAQLRQRHGHFMKPDLLQSQFDALEEPAPAEGVITVEMGDSPQNLADRVKRKLNLK